jgi:hypothetical protein
MINNVPRAKLNRLAIVMVGILVASVALAWFTTKPRKNFSPDGAGIISQLIDDTIEEYWSNADHERWFVGQRRDGNPIGWQMRSRRQISEDEFSGTIQAAQYKSNWTLNTDLSEGSYLGREFDENNNTLAETRITITDNEVTVVRDISGKKRSATSRRPKNYIPEGALPMVLRLVASRGSGKTFKMVLDQNSIVGGNVNFLNARVAPIEDDIVKVKIHGRGFTIASIYQIDSDNNIHKIEEPDLGVIYTPYKKEFVRKLFQLPSGQPASRPAP